jgi:hypothetical protein
MFFLGEKVVELPALPHLSEGPEGVAAEEDLRGLLVGDHGLGPVDIGALDKEELLAFPEVEGIARDNHADIVSK